MDRFEDTFDAEALDETRWLPYYLPHWSSRRQARANYEVGGGRLRLLIEEGQEPWCPEFDGDVRVSSLQTGTLDGQHKFNPDAVVREPQRPARLYTPQYGRIEIRCKAHDDPRVMVALWMIGFEDEPEHSGEICVCEIFGRDVGEGEAGVGVGVHPFGDPALIDDFETVRVPIDARQFHVYAADWTPDAVGFYVDDQLVKHVAQSPSYPMQLMLNIYEFERGGGYPKAFEVDYVTGG
ncbi:MAG TPA: glycoside hydrolase family 16 protein [Thermoleophilaceae bacterium]|nr:glycoside hydrolase family 16 protein [Thermoleophilaceae bacterium]